MGLLGADIAHVVREACMSVLKENRGGVGPVSQRHLLKAVSDTVRSKPVHSTSRLLFYFLPSCPSRSHPSLLAATNFTGSLKSAREAALLAQLHKYKWYEAAVCSSRYSSRLNKGPTARAQSNCNLEKTLASARNFICICTGLLGNLGAFIGVRVNI
jgi:hypothetical protein